MRARAQRSQAQGIDEQDLPAVPKGILEPPPLPPPEIHAKDLPQAKVARRSRRRGGRKGRTTGRSAGKAAAERPKDGSTSRSEPGRTRRSASARRPGKPVRKRVRPEQG
jgi:hypothetical protein